MKGNLVVGQSGGPTAVINNSLVGVIHQAMASEAIEGIWGMAHGIQGMLQEEFYDLRRETPLTLDILRNTPASALGTVRYKVKEEDYARLVEVMKKYDVRYFFYIGGNDSMDTTHKINQMAQSYGYELFCIGVPKTIDNDLALTDHCPGYGSAARFVASAIRNTAYDTEAMGDSGPIKLMEIMGRNAGWLTAASALARAHEGDAPHLIYLPEHPISEAQIAEDVTRVYKERGYCVVAVSEGIKDETGEDFGAAGAVDDFGHKARLGVVEAVAEVILKATKQRARFDKPAYLQRSFAELQSPVDREEAYQAGCEAVRAALRGETGQMVAFERLPGPVYQMAMRLVPLSEVANQERMVPAEYINAAGNDVTAAFLDYARPLIGGPLPPYARLSKQMVAKR